MNAKSGADVYSIENLQLLVEPEDVEMVYTVLVLVVATVVLSVGLYLLLRRCLARRTSFGNKLRQEYIDWAQREWDHRRKQSMKKRE